MPSSDREFFDVRPPLSVSPVKRTKPMRSVKSLVAAGAASLLSSIAFAADMPSIAPSPMYAPAPIEDFGGWYLRGDIGFSNQSVKKLDWFSYPTLLSLNQNTGFDTAGIFGLGVGYQFNNWFRADITGQYRGKSNFHGTEDRKSTRLNSSHSQISYAVFCLKKKK